ncbi:hypothetical protein BDW22DRAFT_1337761 [Trametopsis cervina]|nr:hypothetical protein BDW22DRAFT_1337761 [Trametopsis cervina]
MAFFCGEQRVITKITEGSDKVAVDGTLVRDMWPNGIGRPVADTRDVLDMEPCQLVPETFDELGNFCHTLPVASRLAGKNFFKLAFVPEISPALPDVLLEPTFRFQGVVKDVALAPIGNWNGNSMNCAKAQQRLVLTALPGNEAFEATLTQVANLCEFIHASVNVQSYNNDARPPQRHLVFTREVFKKVNPAEPQINPVVIARMDDPQDRLSRVHHMWQIVHTVRCGVQTATGILQPARHLSIRRGDFVDVAATVKVVMSRREGRKSIRVNFEMQDVYRLYTAAELKVRFQRHTFEGTQLMKRMC